ARAGATFAAAGLSGASGDGLKDVTGFAAGSAEGKELKAQGISVVRAGSGETAVVDSSSAHEGITAAAGKDFVELSWKGYADDAAYVVLRDGKERSEEHTSELQSRENLVCR